MDRHENNRLSFYSNMGALIGFVVCFALAYVCYNYLNFAALDSAMLGFIFGMIFVSSVKMQSNDSIVFAWTIINQIGFFVVYYLFMPYILGPDFSFFGKFNQVDNIYYYIGWPIVLLIGYSVCYKLFYNVFNY